MNYIKIVLTGITLFSTILGSAQRLSKHQWENRLVIVLTEDANNSIFKNQLAEFKKDLDGLNERKLVIYQATPSAYKTGLKGNKWEKSVQLYNKYKKTDAAFEVVLLGLDGGVKLQQSKLLSNKKLFATIDVMPMRRREIERKKRQ